MPISAQLQTALATAVVNIPKLAEGNWDAWEMAFIAAAGLFEVAHAFQPLEPEEGEQLAALPEIDAIKAKYLLANTMGTIGRKRIVHEADTPLAAFRELHAMHKGYVEAQSGQRHHQFAH